MPNRCPGREASRGRFVDFDTGSVFRRANLVGGQLVPYGHRYTLLEPIVCSVITDYDVCLDRSRDLALSEGGQALTDGDCFVRFGWLRTLEPGHASYDSPLHHAVRAFDEDNARDVSPVIRFEDFLFVESGARVLVYYHEFEDEEYFIKARKVESAVRSAKRDGPIAGGLLIVGGLLSVLAGGR